MPQFTTVARLDSHASAEVAAGALRAAGIDVVIETHSPYTESPTAGGEGVVDIRVPEAQADDAAAILQRSS